MTFDDIVSLVCAKIGKTDTYAQARALDFVQRRHKQIWDSFDWTAAKTIVSPTPTTTTFDVSNAEKVISARFNGEFIDPVTPSFIFESHPELIDDTGKPLYYWSHYDTTTSSLSITLYPGIDPAGVYAGKTLDLLVKSSYNTSATTTFISNIDNALIAFVLADMWEFLRQLTKYQAKLQEAQALLTEAQNADSPSVPRPRSSKALTVNGSTLIEMVDSVCDIIGRWEPDIRESVKDRIRRNYDVLWNMQLWPDSLLFGNVDVSTTQSEIILPYYIDKVLGVRTNTGGSLVGAQPLTNVESPWFFGADYTIFEATGEPLYYNLVTPLANSAVIPAAEGVQIASTAGNPGGPLTRWGHNGESDQGVEVFIRGEAAGVEYNEILRLPAGGQVPGPTFYNDTTVYAMSVHSYDKIYTFSKPVTNGVISMIGSSTFNAYGELQPWETERKHMRIEIRPNYSSNGVSSTPGSVLVCGKRKLAGLIDDNDSPLLRNAHQVLINGAAADMFDRLGSGDMATKYAQKAAAQTQILIDGEIKQNTVTPRVIPYVETSPDLGFYSGW